MDSDKRTLLKQQPVAGFKADQYASERLWIAARDGVKVPVSPGLSQGTSSSRSARIRCWSMATDPTAPAWIRTSAARA